MLKLKDIPRDRKWFLLVFFSYYWFLLLCVLMSVNLIPIWDNVDYLRSESFPACEREN